MDLFHASGLLYEPGDVVQPGNWGRVVLGAGPGHDKYFRELWFDEVREEVSPDKPSRLRSFFGVRTIEQLHLYLGEGGGPYAYRVQVPDDAQMCDADLRAFHRLHDTRSPAAARQILNGYWTDARSDYMEVLVVAAATIVERV